MSVDKEEEAATEAKEDNLVAEEAVESAQTMTIEEDRAPNAGVEITDKTTWGVDEEEEIAAMAKLADLAAEEAEKLAQTMNVEEDTAPAANVNKVLRVVVDIMRLSSLVHYKKFSSLRSFFQSSVAAFDTRVYR